MHHPSEGSSELLLVQASFFFKWLFLKGIVRVDRNGDTLVFFIKRSMCFIYFFTSILLEIRKPRTRGKELVQLMKEQT